MDIQKKREFTLHEKRISVTMQLEFIELFHTNPTDFRKKTAAMLRENPDLFNMNEIGTVADEHNHVTLEKFEEFLNELLKPELIKNIYQCIDEDYDDHTVTLTAITRFLSGRSKVAERAKTIIDENWMIETLKEVDIGTIDETGTNMIELDEFKHYFANLKKEIPQDLVIKMFNEIDKNNDGKITSFEYFKWKEGFKQHKVTQYLPAKITKSTTKLKLMNVAYNQKHSKSVGFSDDNYDGNYDNLDENNDNKEIETLKTEILQLKQEIAKKDEIINEKDNQIEQLKIENNLLENKIKKYTKIDNNEDVIKLKKLLAENQAELMMMERDKNNLFKQLEQTYEIVNHELILDKKTPKKVKKHKIKTIDDANDLRKSLKKLKSSIDVKDKKIKKYKSERYLNNNEVNNKQRDSNSGAYLFKNLFVFLKDF
eukprot:387186_1